MFVIVRVKRNSRSEEKLVKSFRCDHSVWVSAMLHASSKSCASFMDAGSGRRYLSPSKSLSDVGHPVHCCLDFVSLNRRQHSLIFFFERLVS